LLASIPYFGWVVAVLVNAIGLGAAWLAFRDKNSDMPVEIEADEKSESEGEVEDEA
jgi:hypothetical protein